MQWYTPLFAWWLPQRAILYGFAAALAVLLLVRAAVDDARHSWLLFAVAGLLVGLLPLAHVQTLIALTVVLAVLAAFHRRREWLGLVAVALPLALPRLMQLARAPHGAAAYGNAYPWLEPGWLAGAKPQSAPLLAVAQAAGQVLSPHWWGFWFVNLGLAVPLCAVLLLALLVRIFPSRAGAAMRRATAWLPPPLLEVFLAGTVLFAACNLIVFQSWDWDNTKVLVYWYLVTGLVVGVLATRAWRHAWMRGATALLPVTMVLTGAVVLLRLLPWTPPQDSVAGPFTIASADERSMAATLESSTPPGSVFLTLGRPNDPVLAVAGRTALMGYYGWLWSYGISFGTRPADEQVLYAGCSDAAACPVRALLRRYGVDYVEIDDRVGDPGAITQTVNMRWWGAQGYPVVARSEHITVYDVRSSR